MKPVMYRTAGNQALPSPRIWADCNRADIMDMGTGYWFHEEFTGQPPLAAVVAATHIGAGHLSIVADTDTVFSSKASELGGYLDIETDADANDAFTMFSEPMCKIVKNSGLRVWLEARLEIGDADADQGFFFGLGEEACQSLELVQDDELTLITETLIGFRIFTGEAAIDCVAQKDDSAEVSILADVTNQTILDTELGAGNTGAKAALADATEMKLGLRFDGKETIFIYVNGVEVIRWTLNATYYDPTKTLCVLLALKAGAAAQSIAVDWIRAAYELGA